MSRAGFLVSFDGPGVQDGRIDVRELAPALLSLGRMIDAANLALNGAKRPVKVEVRAVAVGSFVVHLDAVLNGWDLVKSLIDRADVQEAKTLLEWLGLFGVTPAGTAWTLFKLYRRLGGRSPDRVTRELDGTFQLELDGQTFTVPFEVLRLYRDRAVNQSVGDLLAVLRKDAIEEIKFFEEGGDHDAPAEVLTAEDRQAFTLPELAPQVVIDTTARMALSIRSLAFHEGNKWRLFDGQNVITAEIADADFLSRVFLNLERFSAGDVLICDVRTVQKQGPEGLKKEYTVLKVVEHRTPPDQFPLPFIDEENVRDA